MQNWVTYYVALYLTKNYELCLEVFESIVSQCENSKEVQLKRHEMSDVYLFKATVLEEMGEFKKGVKFLTNKKSEAVIVDDISKY